jgi:hypothetical protein
LSSSIGKPNPLPAKPCSRDVCRQVVGRSCRRVSLVSRSCRVSSGPKSLAASRKDVTCLSDKLEPTLGGLPVGQRDRGRQVPRRRLRVPSAGRQLLLAVQHRVDSEIEAPVLTARRPARRRIFRVACSFRSPFRRQQLRRIGACPRPYARCSPEQFIGKNLSVGCRRLAHWQAF